MNALIAMAKRLSVVLNAMGQERGLWDFTPATAKNAQERESILALSAAGQALFPRSDGVGTDQFHVGRTCGQNRTCNDRKGGKHPGYPVDCSPRPNHLGRPPKHYSADSDLVGEAVAKMGRTRRAVSMDHATLGGQHTLVISRTDRA
jgi:hypothetical protein